MKKISIIYIISILFSYLVIAAGPVPTAKGPVPTAKGPVPTGVRCPIVVVRPMEACKAVDRAWAASLAKGVAKDLLEGGIRAEVADDRMLESTLNGRRLVYLMMPLSPTAAQLGTIKRFCLRGGKVCALYSNSAELARVMGVTPSAAATRAGAGGWWVPRVVLDAGDDRARRWILWSVAGRAVPGSWDAAAALAREKQKALQIGAYAKKQARRPGEIHAVWDHSGTGLYSGDWPRTMRTLAANHITDVFVNVAGAGFAHYPTPCLPASGVCRSHGDQLAACLAAARPHGIRVHAWMLCFNGTRAVGGKAAEFAAKGWRLKNRKGETTEYLNPANPAVRAYVLAAVEDLARRYPVHGVHLDFVRWYEGAAKPAKAADAVTAFVSAARQRVKKVRPAAWLTAAVMGSYPSCVASVGQDWGRWLDLGLVDYVLPMNYVEDNDKFAELVQRQGAQIQRARRVIAGLGVTANESQLGAVKVIDQIRIVRRAGLAGVAFFDLDSYLATEILPYLRMGMF